MTLFLYDFFLVKIWLYFYNIATIFLYKFILKIVWLYFYNIFILGI